MEIKECVKTISDSFILLDLFDLFSGLDPNLDVYLSFLLMFVFFSSFWFVSGFSGGRTLRAARPPAGAERAPWTVG